MRAQFFVIPSVIFGLFFACSNALSDQQPEFNTERNWIIGAGHSIDTILTTPTSSSGTAEVAITEYSICPTHQVELKVFDESDQVIFQVISDTMMVEIFPILNQVKQVKIQAKLIEDKQNVVCVWLGQAKLVYRYVK